MRNQKVMLAVKFSRPAGCNRITWIRWYYADGILTEKVTEIDPSGKIVEKWDNEFNHWFRWVDIPGVRKDYARWGWTVFG